MSRIPRELLLAQAEEVRRHIDDYDMADITKEREELVRRWRAAHPAAASEASTAFHPLVALFVDKPNPKDKPEIPCEPHEVWHNDVYHLTVRRYTRDPVFGTDEGMIQIGISSLDGTARHDWRDFQAIKNQIAGAECEAFELYPAESRLLDPSNYYTLWCFPGIKRIKVGKMFGEVVGADEALAPQRQLARGDASTAGSMLNEGGLS